MWRRYCRRYCMGYMEAFHKRPTGTYSAFNLMNKRRFEFQMSFLRKFRAFVQPVVMEGTALLSKWSALWLLMPAFIVGGCTPMLTVNTEGSTIIHHFGWVRVLKPATSSDTINATSLRTIGMRIGRSMGVGYFDESLLVVPNDCRLVILVRTQAQLNQVLNTWPFAQKDGGAPCVSVSPRD